MTKKESKLDLEKALKDTSLFPPEIPARIAVGKCPLMCPQQPYAKDHPAIPLLNAYAKDGCPVDCGPKWSIEKVKLLLTRGPHISAKSKLATQQLQAETFDKINHGYARVVTWGGDQIHHASKSKDLPSCHDTAQK